MQGRSCVSSAAGLRQASAGHGRDPRSGRHEGLVGGLPIDGEEEEQKQVQKKGDREKEKRRKERSKERQREVGPPPPPSAGTAPPRAPEPAAPSGYRGDEWAVPKPQLQIERRPRDGSQGNVLNRVSCWHHAFPARALSSTMLRRSTAT